MNQRGLLTAKTMEPCPRSCAANLERRIKFLSGESGGTKWWVIGEIFKKWTGGERDLCLCGHDIEQLYVVTSDKNVRVQVGSECIKRFMPDGTLSLYRRSLRVPFYCDVCRKNYVNMESHLQSKKHKEKFAAFTDTRREIMERVVARKLQRYERNMRVPGVCVHCGHVEDMRGHFTSHVHQMYVLAFTKKLNRVLTDKLSGSRPFFETTTKCRDCPMRFDNCGGANTEFLCKECATASLTTYKCRDCPERLDNSTRSWKPRCYKCHRRYTKGEPPLVPVY